MFKPMICQLLSDLPPEALTGSFEEIFKLFICSGKQGVTEMVLNPRFESFEEFILLHILKIQIPVVVIKTGDVYSEVSFHPFLDIRLLNTSNKQFYFLVFKVLELGDRIHLVNDEGYLG